MKETQKFQMSVFNADSSNRHPAINSSTTLAEHIHDRIHAAALRTASMHGRYGNYQVKQTAFPSNMIICVTEYHQEAAEILLDKLNNDTNNRYAMESQHFDDDYITIYFKTRIWKPVKKFIIGNRKLSTENNPVQRQSYKGIGLILKNQENQKIIVAAIHFRRLKHEFYISRLNRLKTNLIDRMEKYGVQILAIAGDFNKKPEILQQCFSSDTFKMSITTSNSSTTKKNSIDNIVITKQLEFLQDVHIDRKAHLTHYPLFANLAIKEP